MPAGADPGLGKRLAAEGKESEVVLFASQPGPGEHPGKTQRSVPVNQGRPAAFLNRQGQDPPAATPTPQ